MRSHFGGPTASFAALEKLLAGMLSKLQQIAQHNCSSNSCSSSGTPASSLLAASASASTPSSLFRAAAVTAMVGPAGAASPSPRLHEGGGSSDGSGGSGSGCEVGGGGEVQPEALRPFAWLLLEFFGALERGTVHAAEGCGALPGGGGGDHVVPLVLAFFADNRKMPCPWGAFRGFCGHVSASRVGGTCMYVCMYWGGGGGGEEGVMVIRSMSLAARVTWQCPCSPTPPAGLSALDIFHPYLLSLYVFLCLSAILPLSLSGAPTTPAIPPS